MKRILAIRTSDKDYAEGLAKRFGQNGNSAFEVMVFTDSGAYSEYIKGNRIDVLLCDEELFQEYKEGSGAKLVCPLSEVSIVNETVCETTPIFKYQASEKIMEEIMARFRMVIQADIPESTIEIKDKRIYSVCSPIGGSYSSTFALALAKYYSLQGKTLFITFDPFFVLPETDKDPKSRDLTDLIFYLDEKENYILGFLRDITIKQGNLECISGVSHWFDLYDMSPQSMSVLLQAVGKSPDYENIIFDVGIIGAASMEVFLTSEKIYVTENDDPGSKLKLDEWKRQLRFCDRADLLERLKEITVPKDELLKGRYSYEDLLSGRVGRFLEESEGIRYSR